MTDEQQQDQDMQQTERTALEILDRMYQGMTTAEDAEWLRAYLSKGEL